MKIRIVNRDENFSIRRISFSLYIFLTLFGAYVILHKLILGEIALAVFALLLVSSGLYFMYKPVFKWFLKDYIRFTKV